MNFSGTCMDILNGYKSKEFETIVELSHKISGMCGEYDDYERKVEEKLIDHPDEEPYARDELRALHDELFRNVNELLDKHPVEIAQAVRTIMFGIPKPLPEKAFGRTITSPEPILESVK